jgi:hypothetical protein
MLIRTTAGHHFLECICLIPPACSPSTIPASGQTNTTKPLQRGINYARLCYRLKPSGKQLATLQKIRSAAAQVTLSYELGDFSEETDRLVTESQRLHDAQVSHRQRLAALNEERQLWADQRDILSGALAEMDQSLTTAASHPTHVECPTCGQEYENSLKEQFGLVEDIDGLISARLNASRKLSELDTLIKDQRANLGEIERALSRVDAVFAIRKAELTFKDVVAAEGRTEPDVCFKRVLRKSTQQWAYCRGRFQSSRTE